jgi:peptidoglycan lytic transglycosylase
MSHRKQRPLVLSPPSRRWPGGLWLAGGALAGHLALAAWTFGGGETQGVASAALPPAQAGLPTGGGLRGLASWYGAEVHGNPTASGEPFDMNDLTAAHRTLPLGSRALVTNPANGRQIVVRINDRGPGVPGVMIDLSRGAARALGMSGSGLVEVQPLAR